MNPVIVWFRQDLRLADNPALIAAIATSQPVVAVYVLDEVTPGKWAPGGASRWWLDKSLSALSQSLKNKGSRLILRRGPTLEVMAELVTETQATSVYCQAAYEPWATSLEGELHSQLAKRGIDMKRMRGSLLKRPDEVRTQSGQAFKVYTPFWRALRAATPPSHPLPSPDEIPAPSKWPRSDILGDWMLHPTKPDWSEGFTGWEPGEAGAQKRLATFLASALGDYSIGRNRPDRDGTSMLSPHLHFGEISPATCWYAAHDAVERQEASGTTITASLETFQKEIAWREFSAHLLINFPHLPQEAFKADYAAFPFLQDPQGLRAWQHGRTGFPIVDAGMRQLWQTGWMHNRVRMITASFLVKDLLLPWQAGAAWFWDTLVDADLASNSASWQWVAGSGADAAPFFRIFNPARQGIAHDPDGTYVRRWVPELADLPNEHIHEPSAAPSAILKMAGVELGRSYPNPIVDHSFARTRALAALKSVQKASA